jgi:hypothetical protein
MDSDLMRWVKAQVDDPNANPRFRELLAAAFEAVRAEHAAVHAEHAAVRAVHAAVRARRKGGCGEEMKS